MTFTDKNIPVKCAECDEVMEGIEAVEDHILSHHVGYTHQDAVSYARHWADAAYQENEEAMAEYYRNRKEDPSE